MDIHENQNIHNLPVPNIEAMREHLEHLFGGDLNGLKNGLIELAWTDTFPDKATGKHKLRHAQLYEISDIDSLVRMAVIQNQKPMCNVYIGAALRKPNTAIFGRADRSDFYGVTVAYADLDDKGPVEKAKDRYGSDKPTLVVVTGREPHTRAQMWWRLSDPITDPDASEGLMRGIEQVLEGDNVHDAPRVMRLAGSVAWPHKPGRIAELTYIKKLEHPGQREYEVAHLEQRFPPVAHVNSAVHTAAAGVYAKDTFGFDDKLDDGRDVYIRDTLTAILVQLIGETGACPTPQELFDVAWPQYQSHAKIINSEGRLKGGDYVAEKCKDTIRRFLEGKISTVPSIDAALESYRRKQSSSIPAEPEIDPHTGKPKPLILTSAEFLAGYTPPAYLIDGVIQRGYLYSLTARTGHGKTAVALYIAQAIARGKEMHGCKVLPGTVLVLAGENPDDVRARFFVLGKAYGFDPVASKIRWIPGVKHLPSHMDIIRHEVETIDDLVLVLVDTAAAYFPGTETNSNSEQGAYARLLRELTFLKGKPAAIALSHPVKNAARDNLLPMGGSAFLNEVDGNLTLWSGNERQTTLHWQGKFRGPEFDPMSFEMVEAHCDTVKDEAGRLLPSVVAKPLSEKDVEASEEDAERYEDRLMRALHGSPKASFGKLAEQLGWSKRRVQTIMERLQSDRLVVQQRSKKYVLTEKGEDEIGALK